MQSVCIIYGLNEGPAMGHSLRKYFRRAGYQISTDPTQADIIFAHSGGCFLIPAHNRASKIILVGLPYWPNRPWIQATVLKVWREMKLYVRQHRFGFWLKKWTYHLWYAFYLGPALRMAANRKLSSTWNSPQAQIIVRNRHDMYSSPTLHNAQFNGPRVFVSMPGEHDDCWDNPESYANLLKAL